MAVKILRSFKSNGDYIRELDQRIAKKVKADKVHSTVRYAEHKENKCIINVFSDNSIGIYLLEDGKLQTVVYDLEPDFFKEIFSDVVIDCEEDT